MLFFAIFFVVCHMSAGSLIIESQYDMKTSPSIDNFIKLINEDVHQDCLALFKKMSDIEKKISNLAKLTEENEEYIVNDVEGEVMRLKYNLIKLSANTTELLEEIIAQNRTNTTQLEDLIEVIKNVSRYIHKIENVELPKFEDLEEEILFIENLKKLNVTLLSKSNSLKKLLIKNPGVDIFVLQYNSVRTNIERKTVENFESMTKNRTYYGINTIFAAINLEFLIGNSNRTENTKISLYKNEELVKDIFTPNIHNGFVWKKIFNEKDIKFDEMIWGTYVNYTTSSRKTPMTFFGRIYLDVNSFLLAQVRYSNKIFLLNSNYFLQIYLYVGTMDLCYVYKENHGCPYETRISITINGKVHSLNDYEILTNPHNIPYKWVRSSPGKIPINSVICGKDIEKDDKVIYCGRMHIDHKDARGLIPAQIFDGVAYAEFYGSNTSREFDYLVYDL